MKYMGSKARFANEILSIVLANRQANQWYVEPFCGGCNMIDNVVGNRIANDVHPFLIAMWKELSNGWIPEKITREFYNDVKNNKSKYPSHIVGWVGFNCSYSGKYFDGFAGETNTKIGKVRDYQAEAIKNVLKQVKNLKCVVFENRQYTDLQLLHNQNSIIYCDPPYKGTTKYAGNFDHNLFWQWVRNMSEKHTVYVSEYTAPDDFDCVWSKTAKSSLSANGVIGGNKESVEKLFVLNSKNAIKQNGLFRA